MLKGELNDENDKILTYLYKLNDDINFEAVYADYFKILKEGSPL